jgi:hypothetical protein
MRTIFLSLLLVLLLFVGILAKPRLERFVNSAKPEPIDVKKIMMSPSFSQMITTPTITPDVKKPGIDALSRDAVVQKATGSGPASTGGPLYDVLAEPHGSTDNFKYYPDNNDVNTVNDEEEKKYMKQCMNNYKKKDQELKCPKCPKCPECPDMSKYVKLDEVPCWNCSLP